MMKQICRLCFNEAGLENLEKCTATDVIRSLLQSSVGYKIPELMCVQCIQEFKQVSQFIEKCQHAQILNQIKEEHMYTQVARIEECNEEESVKEDTVIENCSPLDPSDPNNIETKQVKSSDKEATDLNTSLIETENTKNLQQKKVFNCHICPKAFSSSGNLKKHVKRHKQFKITSPEGEEDQSDSPKNIVYSRSESTLCPKCGKIITGSISKHYKKHRDCMPKNLQCSDCDKICHTPSDLQRHQEVHNSKMSFMCHICSKLFKYVHNLKRHVKQHDRKEAQNKDGIKRVNTQIGQTKTSRNTRVVCEICKKTFLHRGILKMHMLGHEENNIYQCRFCKEEFQSRRLLYEHYNKTHDVEKQYLCDFCSKRFASRSALIQHMRSHTGERPFGCPKCQQRFSQKTHLIYHMRLHNEEKMFSCDFCDKSFHLKGNLTVHRRIHTGERPYQCHVCSKGFRDSSMRKRHVVNQHGAEKASMIGVSP